MAGNNQTIPLNSNRGKSKQKKRGKSAEYSQSRSRVDLTRPQKRESGSRSKGSQSELSELKVQAAKLERSIQMIWECMGDTWHSHREHRQVGEG